MIITSKSQVLRGIHSRFAWGSAISLTLLVASSTISQASSLEDYNQQGLDLAQKKVARQKFYSHGAQVGAHSTHALSAFQTGTPALFGRTYKVGDNWDVAAWQIQSPMMRKLSDPDKLNPAVRASGTFHYEVTAITQDPSDPTDHQITVKVTQTSNDGMQVMDRHVNGMFMSFCDHGVQTTKTYSLRGHNELIAVSAQGLRTPMTPIDLLPLDVPETSTAEKSNVTEMPSMPPEVQTFATRIGFKPNLSQSVWLEQDDFFGRPIEMVWEKGSPWPSYMKTSNGIAILIRKGTL
jgi:hypothetical protein